MATSKHRLRGLAEQVYAVKFRQRAPPQRVTPRIGVAQFRSSGALALRSRLGAREQTNASSRAFRPSANTPWCRPIARLSDSQRQPCFNPPKQLDGIPSVTNPQTDFLHC